MKQRFSWRMKKQTRVMTRLYALTMAAWMFLGGCQPATQKPAQPVSKPASTNTGYSVLTAPVDYIDATMRAGENTKGTLALGAMKKAIESFQQLEERNPDTLDELVKTGYLKVMPSTPHGQEFEYNAATGEVKLVPKK